MDLQISHPSQVAPTAKSTHAYSSNFMRRGGMPYSYRNKLVGQRINILRLEYPNLGCSWTVQVDFNLHWLGLRGRWWCLFAANESLLAGNQEP